MLEAREINTICVSCRGVVCQAIPAHPMAQKYHGAIPEFYFYPESANDPELATYIERAKQVLHNFYESSWFKELETNQQFRERCSRSRARHRDYIDKLRAKRQENN